MVSFLGQPYYRCCLCNEAFLRNAQFWSQDFLLKKNLQIVSLRRQKTVGFLCWWCFGWVEVFLLFEVFLLGIWSSFWPFWLGIFFFVLFCLLGGFFRLAFFFFSLLSKPPVKFLLVWNEWSLTWHIWEQSPACQSCWSAAAPKKPQLLWVEGKDRASSLSLGSAKGADRNLWAHQRHLNPQLCPGPPALPGITRE